VWPRLADCLAADGDTLSTLRRRHRRLAYCWHRERELTRLGHSATYIEATIKAETAKAFQVMGGVVKIDASTHR